VTYGDIRIRLLDISDVLFSFETRSLQSQLGSKIGGKLWTFLIPCKI